MKAARNLDGVRKLKADIDVDADADADRAITTVALKKIVFFIKTAK